MTKDTTIFNFSKNSLVTLAFLASSILFPSFAQSQSVFAIIGDFGYVNSGEQNVANMIKGWNPDYIITVGDNIYENRTTDYSTAVGDYYHEYMFPKDQNYLSDTQSINRFWPVVGNHDWVVGSNLNPYLTYFKMVNNKRYYSVILGDVEFFAIDSDTEEPDGTSSSSTQGKWLQQALANSTARWKIVLFHHPAYCSAGNNTYMQWPFKSWGADAVISGHIHYYERLFVNNLVYFVNGLGGASIKSFSSASSYSQAHYDSNYGAMKITESISATTSTLKFDFFSLDDVNVPQDSYSIDQLLPVELINLSAKLITNSAVQLSWSTATEVNNYGFDIERSSANTAWSKIGFVAGSGNSNSPKSYSFTDSPTGGTTFSYRLKQIDVGGSFKYYDPITVNLAVSSEPQLMQNSPNPFNPSTTIKFYIPNTSDVSIKIYDILGREVNTLINQQTTAGYHIVYWNGKNSRGENVSSGIYLYRLTAGSFSETKKMNLLK